MAVLRKSISAPRPAREYGPESAASDARKIAQQNLLKLVPLDVFGLAAVLGLNLVTYPMEEATSGFLQNRDGRWDVGVNSLHHVNRQRFTVAHELGHFMLHRDHGSFMDGLLFRKSQVNPQEREANLFASLLLMPEVEFRLAVANYDISEVAKTFAVSQQAVQFRIENLGQSAVRG
ncbi:ImmA/IrrE family metallo-endopeptidase [Rhizobium leguminosarum]|uniref:ImmA/IrrE family metallo-endopeptidase n=1 Tax=Rhizobium leguminosarum bv. viciae TaxID=387 RepID=A0A8G2J5V9_RHILV|nr:ImmA/IrrE family metallo-endopeptidase [Rhizobium leguminosarum]MBY5619957.1 ImmA/IrrE family metallo-endopeptidase [Rhizobium leguminosarum]NKK18609.1 ImmA/IrrE family metallo-endopeptidase [Rhizobium leguminosarum bv. viciae]TBX98103.1 ImmA/IrrE family metallo-endopeptidase [Rhizobium leguminosarum bv. viciae]TBZ09430.1 ImmA/IrrE family metallo-endopeptidase [Rhizobium leguminosarum bv. viciae]TBZ10939.1 ImmA/IrrE family metallo-endopeptidase [Rhizobium leguminosarum bv. viciae]